MVICKNLERSNKVVTVCCYIMTGNYSEVFSIGRETGVIRTNRQLVSVVKSRSFFRQKGYRRTCSVVFCNSQPLKSVRARKAYMHLGY